MVDNNPGQTGHIHHYQADGNLTFIKIKILHRFKVFYNKKFQSTKYNDLFNALTEVRKGTKMQSKY